MGAMEPEFRRSNALDCGVRHNDEGSNTSSSFRPPSRNPGIEVLDSRLRGNDMSSKPRCRRLPFWIAAYATMTKEVKLVSVIPAPEPESRRLRFWIPACAGTTEKG